MNLNDFLHDFEYQDGIWYAPGNNNYSYPVDGNNLCYEIEDQSFWFKNRNRIISSAIRKYSIDGPIFDIGGGNGFVTNYLINEGFESVLIEPGLDGCINGKARGLKYVVNSIFDTTHFFANSIPNIGIFDVLEHIENQDNFLRTLYSALVPNGRLFITVPAFNCLWSGEDNYAGHFNRYKIDELKKLVVSSRFDILYSTYFFSFLFLPVLLFRALPSRIGFYRSHFQKSKNHHISGTRNDKLIDAIIKIELKNIIEGISMKLGSSILLVANKK